MTRRDGRADEDPLHVEMRLAGGRPPTPKAEAWELPPPLRPREFALRREGMLYAMDGGLWLHRHVWKGRPMAHLVSVDRELLLDYARAVGLPAERLQYKPLKDPRTGARRDAWHWDLLGPFLPRVERGAWSVETAPPSTES